jgi:hypothetical protein
MRSLPKEICTKLTTLGISLRPNQSVRPRPEIAKTRLPAEFDHPHVNRKEDAMRTHQFGRKLKLPATIAIKHQIRKLMFEDALEQAEAAARAESIRGQTGEETRPLVPSA